MDDYLVVCWKALGPMSLAWERTFFESVDSIDAVDSLVRAVSYADSVMPHVLVLAYSAVDHQDIVDERRLKPIYASIACEPTTRIALVACDRADPPVTDEDVGELLREQCLPSIGGPLHDFRTPTPDELHLVIHDLVTVDIQSRSLLARQQRAIDTAAESADVPTKGRPPLWKQLKGQ